MKFFMVVDTNNAAFEEYDELLRILHQVARQVTSSTTGRAILDSNGNRVGEWGYASDMSTLVEGAGNNETTRTVTLTIR